ncbi:H-NS family nucleoid-associated regulatory protein [Paraburkholderia saeva]|uniref:H-NS family nucleoid-associated regulatory protein n=1 Tax=Paraburkholderia saeva TaxID=2777537 RepID=UPI001E51FA56|nr:H-NS family nucleoid-associated regulatory protein [Paraburkholderia saeva]
MRSYDEIQAEIKRLQQEALESQKREAAIARIRLEMKRFGISADELGEPSTRKGAVAPKAMGAAKKAVASKRAAKTPVTSDESPAVRLLMRAGVDFSRSGAKEIKPPSRTRQAEKAEVASTAKRPPRYRDPKTGATWSGHARPPAWIRDAKDRSVYLIDHAGVPAARKQATTQKRPARADLTSKGTVRKAAS